MAVPYVGETPMLDGETTTKQFNLLRWFSLASLLIIASVAISLGVISTRFVVDESIERDAMLSAQFIQAIADVQVRYAELPPDMPMSEYLDPRRDILQPAVTQQVLKVSRKEFLDHISNLPDVLLANIYAQDRVIIWSTNPELIGKSDSDNFFLEEAFRLKRRVASSHYKVSDRKIEQKFLRMPEDLFIENYIPLLDGAGNVMSMIEIYKEPMDLIARIQRGYVVIWLTAGIGGGLIYFSLYWIVRRASVLLASQQKQLIANETFVTLGEMSSSVAHSLRNPLAVIRSSAELALELAGKPATKNINDIIDQVDRMSKWVRDLLITSRPLSGESETVDPAAAIRDTLYAFEHQLKRSKVEVELTAESAPAVISQRVLLSQVLNSLLANAIEAMPEGGRLGVKIEQDGTRKWLHMTIHDSGKGMSRQQEMMAFKPFYTTKQGGLGVGLVMVKRIMERFGGKVSLVSREQKGTSVCLSFRIAEGGSYGTQHIDCRG
jgi:signal transduction histidine kinase